jgi:serine/threonine protein kinase
MAAMSVEQESPEELETLHDLDAATAGGPATAFAVGGFGQRYTRGEPLGAGGMGVVQAWRDRATGREVAIKTIRGSGEGTAALRFVREARVQAQLEHPSIVPVYDVGVDPGGALYFTMKRVRGHSLQRVLHDGDSGYSLRKLLTVMARVARTVEYAHRRGVVNRDLKPANLMLGEFDEIYVLDWGLAQVRDAGVAGPASPGAPLPSPPPGAALAAATGPAAAATAPAGSAVLFDGRTLPMTPPGIAAAATAAAAALAAPHDASGGRTLPTLPTVPVGPAALAARAAGPGGLLDSSQRPETGAGQVLGTLGYLAPEQLEAPERVDHRCDIYALGAILFEILSGERLHSALTYEGVLISTLEIDGASPADRAPGRGVPPELDALVHAATRRDPAARPASAAQLADAIDAYLDGDRDLARRRELSVAAAAAAHEALIASRIADAGAEPALRAAAVRDVGRALALDPDNAVARTTLLQALTEPPRVMPPAAEAAYRAGGIASIQISARNASRALLSYAVYVPLILWMGVRRPWLFGGTIVSTIVVIALTARHHRQPPTRLTLPWSHVVVSTVAFAFGMSLFGPLVLLPSLVMITGVAYVATFERSAIACVVPFAAVIFVPLGLQLVGVLPPSYDFADGTLRMLPGMADLPPIPTLILLVIAHLIVVIGSIGFVWRLRCAHRDVERRLALQAWQLSQLVPEAEPPRAPRTRASQPPPTTAPSGQDTLPGTRRR